MTILEFCLFLVTLFNTIILIGIAGSIAKLIRYIHSEDSTDKDQWAKIIKQRRVLQIQEGNEMSYADALSIPPKNEIKNWDGIPRKPNWNGLPEMESN